MKFIKYYKIKLNLLLIFLILSGCTFQVKLVGEYDEILDKSVTELQELTASYFASLKFSEQGDPELSYKSNKAFYRHVQGKIATLIRRSEVIEQGLKRNPITSNFKDLQLQYADLATQHKKQNLSKRYIESSEKAFDQSFRAILENILYLKWNQSQPNR